jgi:hypothetical protein
MKKITLFLLSIIIVVCNSCSTDNNSEKANFAVPVIKSLASIRSSINIEAAKQTNSDGKIYVSQNDLFYIAKEQGVHIFDNQNPANPTNVAFINIEGVHDIAIKDNYLYADNFVDLLVFDISNLQNITLVKTIENAIEFYAQFPEEADFYDYTSYPNQDEIITGFTIVRKNKPTGQDLILANDATGNFESASAGNVGVGGSYAKFQINNNALYTLDSYKLNVFNITNPVNTFFDKSIYMETWIGSGQFETLFKQKEYLFVGATNGMHIVNALDEFNPVFISGFSHATACDPVVVFANTAYITVRGGSTCGAIEDQVNVIDFTDVYNPTLISTYNLNQPYGLGIKDGVLYVCCGTNGLKVFNANNSANLVLENTYSNNVKDVIPLENVLITVGNNTITQYNYGENYTLNQISVLNL